KAVLRQSDVNRHNPFTTLIWQPIMPMIHSTMKPPMDSLNCGDCRQKCIPPSMKHIKMTKHQQRLIQISLKRIHRTNEAMGLTIYKTDESVSGRIHSIHPF